MNAGGVDKACKSCGRSLQLPALGSQLMENFRFLNLRVYEDAKIFHHKVISHTRDWPREFEYFRNQLRRATLSAVLNIAEGSAKYSDKDFNRYVTIALGSITECASCIDIALDEKLLVEEIHKELLNDAMNLKNSLGSLSKRLKS